jgi:hypothetical protein
MAEALSNYQTTSKLNEWFGAMVHQLRTHEMQLKTGTASDELSNFYEALINGEEIKVLNETRQGSTKFFVKKVVEMYIKELSLREVKIQKLAFFTSDERVLVWLQLEENDEGSENSAILAQSKVNSSFQEHGFHIESMIVEDSDNLEIPKHYDTLFG